MTIPESESTTISMLRNQVKVLVAIVKAKTRQIEELKAKK